VQDSHSLLLGNTILGADKDGYCDDSEWQGLLADCLVCANKFDIWKYYGNGVTSAAEGCGLDAVPSPTDSGPTSPPETSEPPTATEPPAETTSAPDSEPTASETSGPEPSGPEATGSETSGPEGSAPYPTATVSGAATGTGATSVAHTCVYLSGTCANQTFEQPSSSPTETFVSVSGAIKGRDIPAILALGLSVFAWVF